MPNPKVGTVTMDVRKAVEESKAGKVEYRTDRTAIVHMVVGKTSFEDEQLLGNYQAVIEELIRAKPSVAKGKYIRSIVMASTHGPGREGRSVKDQRLDRGGRFRGLATVSPSPRDFRHATARSPGQEEPAVNREEKAAVIEEVARQINRGGGDLRGRLPRRLGAAGRRAARPPARGRRHLPRRQEHADRARGRPGRRRGAEGLPRGPDRHDLRPRRRGAGRQGARRLPPHLGPAGLQGRLDERGDAVSPDQMDAIARLPTRDVLYGRPRRHGRVAAHRPRHEPRRPDRRAGPPAVADRRAGPRRRSPRRAHAPAEAEPAAAAAAETDPEPEAAASPEARQSHPAEPEPAAESQPDLPTDTNEE